MVNHFLRLFEKTLAWQDVSFGQSLGNYTFWCSSIPERTWSDKKKYKMLEKILLERENGYFLSQELGKDGEKKSVFFCEKPPMKK